MTARTQAFILLVFGGALVRLATSDVLLRYVRPVARPWVLLAGIGILGVAVWNLIASARADSHSADAHGHPTATRLAWLVLAPILAILVISPPALGSYSASRESARVPQPAQVDFPPLPTGDPAPVSLLNFATRVIWDSGRTVAGRSVRMTGFVLTSNSQGFILSRLVITCCAADAQPVNVQVLARGSAYSVNSWVSVTGVYAGLSPTQKTLPELRATDTRQVEQPANPYDD